MRLARAAIAVAALGAAIPALAQDLPDRLHCVQTGTWACAEEVSVSIHREIGASTTDLIFAEWPSKGQAAMVAFFPKPPMSAGQHGS